MILPTNEIQLRVGQRNYDGENIFGLVMPLTGLYKGTIPLQPWQPGGPRAEVHYYGADRAKARDMLTKEGFELD